jgi:alpha-D-xyloside xylohydrolase
MFKRFFIRAGAAGIFLTGTLAVWPQSLQLERSNATVLVEPYAPNIVRVSVSMLKDETLAPPGYGVSAKASPDGWRNQKSGDGDGIVSSGLQVWVDAPPAPRQHRGGGSDIAKYFGGSTPHVGIHIKSGDGTTLVDMRGWQMAVPNYKDGTSQINYDRRPTDKAFYTVGATFSAAQDEHDYGLGQNQEGFLDRRGHVLRCAHDYNAPSGQTVCVPFVVTNKGYAILWDNPSRTTVSFGFNSANQFLSEVGRRVTFFIIAGNYEEQYKGFRHLTGETPMLPKSAYGYIQCKQRYSSQAELLEVAKGYRSRHLPADDLVIDWFTYTKMGEMDMSLGQWPSPENMLKELHEMNYHVMISVWPRFVPESRYYGMLRQHGWLMHLADGTPTNGLPYDRAGSDIDTTNPEAAKWYWDIIKKNYVDKGFDSFWADETEPDLPPNGSYFHIGPGTEFFNVYPLFHTAAFYNGMRKDMKERALILARDAYPGAQHNGAIFWSGDISPTWDVLKRQIPTGINYTASGMPYWSTDIGGWQALPSSHTPDHNPLLDPSDARDVVGNYDDYPELYTRWFQYGTFQPNFRTHGTRKHNEVWSYGRQAEPILEKYLRLRYQLLPYIYSLAYTINQTGAPMLMRGLFLDFGNDPNVANIGDEYMFGPALLVAPVTEQGATSKRVYLPAGTDWFNFWTNERIKGGRWITAEAPIDTIPLFVRAGSIIPLGAAIESTNEKQALAKVRVYAGADGDFALYSDDGKTYSYEKGDFQLTHLHWSQAAHKLTRQGPEAWRGLDSDMVEVIGQ